MIVCVIYFTMLYPYQPFGIWDRVLVLRFTLASLEQDVLQRGLAAWSLTCPCSAVSVLYRKREAGGSYVQSSYSYPKDGTLSPPQFDVLVSSAGSVEKIKFTPPATLWPDSRRGD